MNNDRTIRHDDLNRAFKTGTVWSEPEEKLRTHIQTIAEGAIPNSDLALVEIVRALAINHIQMARTIERLNTENGIVAKRVLVLTWISVACGIIQAIGVFWMIFHGA